MSWEIEAMRDSDWPNVRDIYLEGLATGNASFQTEAPDFPGWDIGHLEECRLVAREGAEMGGWAALSPVSQRACYTGVAEVSIYVAAAYRGKGVGRRLLDALIAESERNGIWTLQAGIFPENRASLALHERAGFRVVGRRERIGQRGGQWRDTVLLERRSKTVGI
jgi:L-amino acid N-acyltransferase YncA